ncbi:MAG TPA: hypothetical protein PLJ47_08070 [Candidatus Hydrogenedentes bacterium]|nr:hypothetical protein [Candidatus Hydrogenedentota bacterium]
MESLRLRIILIVCFVTLPSAMAKEEYLDDAIAKYPSINNTALDSCTLCHTIVPARNSYGADFKSASNSFTAIENDDSDGDNTSNIDEINALTFPGDDSSYPPPEASVTVKKPNGGETWTLGTKAKVTWTSKGDVGTDVSIELWQNGQKVKTLKKTTPNDSKQNVKLKTTLPTGSGFTVKVKSVSNPAVADESNSGFTINPASP